MKTLKFMLAAATAIGLTTASQAGVFPGSTNFEDLNAGAVTISGFFQFDGAEGDNESEIIGESVSFAGACGRPYTYAGTADSKYLKVSTGEAPLLCKLNSASEGQAVGSGIYIDTLVQFTVTPSTDDVTTNAADKLLIYLKENGAGSTNLYVKAAKYVAAYEEDGDEYPEVLEPHDVMVTNSVVAGEWYRLTVESSVVKDDNDADLLIFKIKLNGNPLSILSVDGGNADPLYGESYDVFPSLLGRASTRLVSVGFAGEGCVDDLAMTTVNPFNPTIDFTLTLGSSTARSCKRCAVGR